MSNERTGGAQPGWQRDIAGGIAQALLLVPEALLIALLLCVYWAIGEPALVGIIVTLLIISFLTRLLALVAWSPRLGVLGSSRLPTELMSDQWIDRVHARQVAPARTRWRWRIDSRSPSSSRSARRIFSGATRRSVLRARSARASRAL